MTAALPDPGGDAAEGARPDDGGVTPSSRRSGRRTHVVTLFVIATVVLLADLVSKQAVLAGLTAGDVIALPGGFFSLRLVLNPGAAFSFATGMTWVFTLIAAAVVVVVVRVARRLDSRAWAVALGLLLGGAVGNLLDRLFRPPGFARGHVVDFIDYGGFFVGNVADIAIVVAAVLMGWLAVRGIGVDGTRERSDDEGSTPGGDDGASGGSGAAGSPGRA
jgi:signal peptidase II